MHPIEIDVEYLTGALSDVAYNKLVAVVCHEVASRFRAFGDVIGEGDFGTYPCELQDGAKPRRDIIVRIQLIGVAQFTVRYDTADQIAAAIVRAFAELDVEENLTIGVSIQHVEKSWGEASVERNFIDATDR